MECVGGTARYISVCCLHPRPCEGVRRLAGICSTANYGTLLHSKNTVNLYCFLIFADKWHFAAGLGGLALIDCKMKVVTPQFRSPFPKWSEVYNLYNYTAPNLEIWGDHRSQTGKWKIESNFLKNLDNIFIKRTQPLSFRGLFLVLWVFFCPSPASIWSRLVLYSNVASCNT